MTNVGEEMEYSSTGYSSTKFSMCVHTVVPQSQIEGFMRGLHGQELTGNSGLKDRNSVMGECHAVSS